MLQNACRTLWNMTQTVLMRVVAGTLHLAEDPLAEGSTDIDALRKALWQKFYFGADRLLDMMVVVQEQIKTESEQNKKVFTFSYVSLSVIFYCNFFIVTSSDCREVHAVVSVLVGFFRIPILLFRRYTGKV